MKKTVGDCFEKLTAEEGNRNKVLEEFTVAASFMQLYNNNIGGDAIGLILLNEAFNNMDDERIRRGTRVLWATSPADYCSCTAGQNTVYSAEAEAYLIGVKRQSRHTLRISLPFMLRFIRT